MMKEFADFLKGYGIIGRGHWIGAVINLVIVAYFVSLTAKLVLREKAVAKE